jgi:hypothetical protein
MVNADIYFHSKMSTLVKRYIRLNLKFENGNGEGQREMEVEDITTTEDNRYINESGRRVLHHHSTPAPPTITRALHCRHPLNLALSK